mmetsp:Transcript_96384/g.171323  ORF Transcript_96384/g.171323 Transcript_96384/m.171323 type:complete len:571 (+) Transcript_96384:19-1731(+)|eukprot:CAMPEP_0197623754 /NCGR_PEP_ID=MMETSP1338-20131121/3693_1 /TAXON_ID=43686 ORGANISM="Pelagodinium beii, Strain RCC1491" /NCGR_SAMPLE_ID=MMETSP1338 /ASSEMBLY_ACC=CAM_ASM_000754 /LENGTH=570 /DNA_ID=CAMNT_0043193821 /DNA_START=19 /DNA_END=1731 /DNA_ORIENTATION=+
MVVISLDDGKPRDVEEALKDISTTWNNFMVETVVRSREGSPDNKISKEQVQAAAPVAKEREQQGPQASAKRTASPKKRQTSRTKKPQDSKKPQEREVSEIKVTEDMIKAAISTDEVKEALDGLARAFQSGNAAASSAAVERLVSGGRDRPKLERFPTPPGFEEAWSKMQKSPKCPGGLGKGTNFFGTDGFKPPDRSTALKFPEQMQRQIVASDWKLLQAKSKIMEGKGSKTEALQKDQGSSAKASTGKVSGFLKNFTTTKDKGVKGLAQAEESAEEASSSTSMSQVSMDFDSLAKMNAGIIGANMSWFSLVLKNFEQLLAGAVNANAPSLESACDVLALQLSKEANGNIALKEFQTCLLASTRALLPEVWDAQHESAWISCWNCIAEQLQQTLPLPARYEKAVAKLVGGLSDEQMKRIGAQSFVRLFQEHPRAENYFKQSNARLAFIVEKGLEMSVKIFQDPVRMVDEVTSLGLRHIMFQASAKFFQPFVTAVMAEVQVACRDELGIEGLNWALCVIGSIMVRTLEQGSTPILKAVVRSDTKELKRALSKTPRGDRTKAILGSGQPTGRR